MQRFFISVIQPLLEILAPGRIVEIGAAEGGNSRLVASWCLKRGAHLDVIDTAPRFDVATFEREYPAAKVHVGSSLDVLPRLSVPDVVLIDGDHNWYTVYHELQSLSRAAEMVGRVMPVCIFHDTGWPYGRRDLYYEPNNIPEAHRLPYRRAPLTPGVPTLGEYGLNPHLCHAEMEGGLHNGVQTAIEDFVQGAKGEFRITHLPVLFGLSLLTHSEIARQPAVSTFLDSLQLSPGWQRLIAMAENERCHGFATMHRLMPLPQPPDLPKAAPIHGRSFSPNLPAESLLAIQNGVFKQKYRGRMFYKSPLDTALYLQLIERLHPRTVIEIGTAQGGSAMWFADMLAVRGIEGRVITVDRQQVAIDDPRITTLTGSATELDTVISAALLESLPRPWLVVEDSAHTCEVCLAVLDYFDAKLMPGDYIVIEDGVVRGLPGEKYRSYMDGPSRAIESFLRKRGEDYEIDSELCDLYGYNVTYNPNGWLRRKASVV